MLLINTEHTAIRGLEDCMAKDIIRAGISRALEISPSGIPSTGSVEAFFRRQICLEANRSLRIWSGKPPRRSDRPWHKSYVLTKTYDLCWSRPDIPAPEVIMQMKVGGFHSRGQEAQELISDVLYAGYDQLLLDAPVCFYTCTILFESRVADDAGWSRLKMLRRPFYIVLNPSLATNDRMSFADCIDVGEGVIAPTMRSHINNIFGGTQAAKFIGLYRKPGQVEILVRPIVFRVGGMDESFTVLLWQVMNTCLTGSGHTLESWMP